DDARVDAVRFDADQRERRVRIGRPARSPRTVEQIAVRQVGRLFPQRRERLAVWRGRGHESSCGDAGDRHERRDNEAAHPQRRSAACHASGDGQERCRAMVALNLQYDVSRGWRFAMKTLLVATLLCAVALVVPSAYTTKYRVTVTADKQVNFSKLKTYSWLESHFVANEQIEGQIMSAIDRELHDLGLTDAKSGQADVVVTYAAYSRTDVQYKQKQISKDVYPAYPVGILVVSLL